MFATADVTSHNARRPLFDRIVFTGDVLRPFKMGEHWESGTWKNIRWLAHMLQVPLEQTGLPLVRMAWDTFYTATPAIAFDTPAVYAELDLQINPENWARLANLQQPPAACVDRLKPLQGTLVIGYELPGVMLSAFDRLGIAYIDVALHPIRFMPDLVFAFRSNVGEFQAWFERFRLNDDSFRTVAEEIRAKATWMQRHSPRLIPGTALILGQVSNDRAMVLENGEFASLNHHLQRLHSLCAEHSEVLFKPHPYEQTAPQHATLLQALPTLKPTRENLYLLLSQPELVKVVALNSSGLIEARAFGVASENLIPYLYDFGAGGSVSAGTQLASIPLSSIWLQPAFWRALFSGSDPHVSLVELKDQFLQANRLRKSLNADWGWGEIDKVIA